MQFDEKTIKRIKEKYKDAFEALEYYDKTHKKLWGRERIDVTLNRKTIRKLKEIKKKTGIPVSQLIEDALINLNQQ